MSGTIGRWRRSQCAWSVIAVLGAFAGPISGGAAHAAPAPAPIAPLRIVLTNDDGFAAPGLAAAITALRAIEGVQLTVVAPAFNQSGTGSATSDRPVTGVQTLTPEGVEVTAVNGFPADAALFALHQTEANPPQLVVSGINAGQNLGYIATDFSGTVGAARAAAAQGVLAIAVSQGLGAFDYPAAARLLSEWVVAHRAELTVEHDASPKPVVNLNVPSCASGTALRGLLTVPLAGREQGNPLQPADCASTIPAPATDVEAFNAGFATLTELPAAPPG